MANCSMAGASVFQASSRLNPSGAENDTRMKKRPLFRSPNWALSVMLQPFPASRVAMAATIPGLSAQDRVRTKAGFGQDMMFPDEGALGPPIMSRLHPNAKPLLNLCFTPTPVRVSEH